MMPSRWARPAALVAALLVLPMLVLAVVQPLLHQGHGCHLEKDCLACRWAADTVAEATAPVVLPEPLEPIAVAAADSPARAADGSPEAASSRGPPLS
jgi:hypothetical protein